MRKNNTRGETSQIGDVVNRILKAYQLDDKLDEMIVFDKWEDMMGKAVSLRTKSLKIVNKVLVLELDSAVMREELVFGKNVIIQRVNETVGKELITDVFFK